ncbi:MAG: hypothetical protein OEM52_03535 [bacterium]|nr:hypothetical protein [bacterium]
MMWLHGKFSISCHWLLTLAAMLSLTQLSFAQTALSHQTPVSFSDSLHQYSIVPTDTLWSVIGVRSPGTVDYNLAMYSDENFRTLIAQSNLTGSGIDFLVADFHHAALQNYYLQTESTGGTGAYSVEYANSVVTIPNGNITVSQSWTSTTVVRMYQVYLNAGTQSITLNRISGNANLGFAVFNSNNASYFAGRSDALAVSDGDNSVESVTLNVARADWYGVVVWSNSSSVASYTIGNVPRPSITMTTPNGGESWNAATTREIQWYSSWVTGSVAIDVNRSYPTGTWETVVASTSNSGTYAWGVTSPGTTTARIRIRAVNNATIADTSDGNFTIIGAPTITVTSPNGGESWSIGSTYPITWISSGVTGNVSIDVNRGYPTGAWTSITNSTANSGTYDWIVNAPTATTTRVRIRSVTTTTIGDTSNANFTIAEVPLITVTAPNGGESFVTGQATNITWTSSAVTGNVAIRLNRNYPSGTWESISDNAVNNGIYPWSVSGLASTTARIRITSIVIPAVGDTSNANFTITQPSITVTSPNGGEIWALGTPHNVTWSSSGVTGAVSIQLNRGYPTGTWETLTDSTTNDGSYSWTLTGATSSTARIRIRSYYDPFLGDSSNANFTISALPSVEVIIPNGGEQWNIGTQQVIRWLATGFSGNLRIELNRDYPSGTWTSLWSNALNDSNQTWTVTAPATANARIRIRSAVDTTIGDTSNTNFAVVIAPRLTVTAPNGGETATIGANYNITWTSQAYSNAVAIDLNRSYPSENWEILTDSTANDSLYQWAVTGAVSTTARIRIRSYNDAALADTSNANFTIAMPPNILVVAPNGGESWVLGSQQIIQWIGTGFTGNVSIQINRNYPSGTWQNIITNTPNDSNQVWTVSGALTANARIRVRSTTNSTIGDTCDADFAVVAPPSITVASPNGGESWQIGSPFDIRWTSVNLVGNVAIELNRSYPTGTWEVLFANSLNDSVQSWTVTGATTTTARIRITSLVNPGVGDTSSANFTIAELAPPSVTVTVPNGGENWQTGTTQNITWTSFNLAGNVAIQLKRGYPNGTWETLAADVPNNGSYGWNVAGTASTASRIRIRSTVDTTVADTSNANFTISVPQTLTVLTPNGGDSLAIGSVFNVSWTSTGLTGNVAIDLNRTYPAGTWSTITGNTSNDGTYNWTVSAPVSSTARIRIRSLTATTVVDTSNADFTIYQPPVLTVTVPNGAENWVVGTTQNITWTSSGVTGNVAIELNRTYPAGTWESISENTENDSVYSWLVTGTTATTTARIRIRSLLMPQLADTSNNNFRITIPQTVTVTSPNGGEAWSIGTQHPITWTTTGTVGNVIIDINRTYPTGTWSTIVASTANTGSYNWTVTTPTTSSARIRVRIVATPTIGDTSAADFTIVYPAVTLLTPNGGEALTVDSLTSITWNAVGAVGAVRVDLNRNYPSGTWESIGDSVPTTNYSWTVTGAITTTARIRVTSLQYSAVGDTSDNDFSIVFVEPPNITVVYPNGGETLYTSQPYDILWTSHQIVGNVTLQANYGYPNGAWDDIAINVPNTGSYTWVIEDFFTTQSARIRILSVTNPTLGDTSNFDFTIRNQPAIQLLEPNGGDVWRLGTTATINWTSSNVQGNVRLELNRSYPTGTWENITTNTPNDGSENWVVTGSLTTTARIRIRSLVTPTLGDTSDTDFTIANPTLQLTDMGNGGSYFLGYSYSIGWINEGVSGNVRLQLNRNYPTGAWDSIATVPVADLAYLWFTVPPTTMNGRFRILSVINPAIGDTSDNNVELHNPTLTVSTPNGGEVWMISSVRFINWSSWGVSGNLQIELNRNYPTGTWDSLSTVLYASNGYGWGVTGPETNTARIRIRSLSFPSAIDVSDADFMITQPAVTLQHPNGGEILYTGTTDTIRWISNAIIGDVRIQINRNYPSGAWDSIETVPIENTQFVWSVTSPVTTTARIRLQPVLDPLLADTSDANFLFLHRQQ